MPSYLVMFDSHVDEFGAIGIAYVLVNSLISAESPHDAVIKIINRSLDDELGDDLENMDEDEIGEYIKTHYKGANVVEVANTCVIQVKV